MNYRNVQEDFAGGCDLEALADRDWWPIHVAALEDSIKKDPDMPPLIVHFVENDFELNDGNTRV